MTYKNLNAAIPVVDAPGHGRIGGHYFHTWCPYVRTSVRPYVRTSVRPKNKNALQRLRKICDTMGAKREINENLLAVAWWVILNSPDFNCFFLKLHWLIKG